MRHGWSKYVVVAWQPSSNLWINPENQSHFLWSWSQNSSWEERGGGLEEANCYGTTAEEFCWARDIYEARWISYTTANLPPAEL